MFDVAVVGRGLVGSAAARHLGEQGSNVVLIGAGEADDYAASSGPFSSHYDEGRITRVSSADMVWSEIAARSIERYADIAARSSIEFYEARGLAQVSFQAQAAVANAVERGSAARIVDREWLRETTGIAVRDDHGGDIFYEGAPAGVINPRRLVAAQSSLASMAGATLFDAPASKISSNAQGFEIQVGDQLVEAKQILLATGAYGASLVGVDLALERRLRTIVLAELGPGREIPTFIDEEPGHPALEDMYWVPPVRYPDGRTMLKIGGDSLPKVVAEDEAHITAWFQQGTLVDETEPLQAMIRDSLPDATIESWDHKPCVVTYTPTSKPYIGFIDDGVAVALGASGSGAKSSDEIGRLASTLFSPDGWTDSVVSLDTFTPQLAS